MGDLEKNNIVIEEILAEGKIDDIEKVFNKAFKDYETIFEVTKEELKWENSFPMNNAYFLAKCFENPVGLIQIVERIVNVNGSVIKVGMVAKVAVLDEYRKRGIFKLLLNKAELYAKSRGYDAIVGYANRNEIISQLFLKYSYRALVCRYGVVRVLDADIMAKALGREEIIDLLRDMSEITSSLELAEEYEIVDYNPEYVDGIKEMIEEMKFDYYPIFAPKEMEWRFEKIKQEFEADTKLLLCKNRVVGLLRCSIKNFWFRKKNECAVKNLTIDDCFAVGNHVEALKILVNIRLSEAKKQGIHNVVAFFPVNTTSQKMFEDLKFISEIDTVLMVKSLSSKGELAFSKKIRNFFDYYI